MSKTLFSMRRNLALAAGVLGFALSVSAQIQAHLVPITSTFPADVPPGTRLDHCPGSYGPPMARIKIPLEWEAIVENEGLAQVTTTFTNVVTDGANGGRLQLVCPPTLLPPGVNPATDVSCNAATGTISVRNIRVDPCGRARLRYETLVADMSGFQTICDGGDVNSATSSVRTTTPLPSPVPATPPSPSPATDTCIFVNPSCDMRKTMNLKAEHRFTDVNGPPLLPGDTIRVLSTMDLRYMDVIPSVALERYWENEVVGNAGPLPAWIDFGRFTAMPLLNATYEYNPGTRVLRVFDPDTAAPPSVDMPARTFVTIVEWEGTVNCNIPASSPQCMRAVTYTTFGFLPADDPTTFDLPEPDETCVISVQPDYTNSTKAVTDANMSGDAQPGEQLTFTLDVNNAASCPTELLSCECAGTDLVVLDTVDPLLNNIVPLDGGVLTGNTIRWDIPDIMPAGRSGDTRTVRFRANVLPTATAGQTICNTATVTSAELQSVADGGKLNCASEPPVSFSLNPCIRVVIPPTPSVSIAKSITSPVTPGPWVVGTPVSFNLNVSNGGGAPATNVEVWDCLDARWDTLQLNIMDGGTLNGAPNPGCAGSWIRWPTIASLPGNGGSQNFRFTATIPLGTADLSMIPNTGNTRSTQTPTVTPSTVSVPVCAPVFLFEKTLPQASYAEGDTITWTLTVENTGSCDATGVVITDAFNTTILNEPPTITGPGTYDTVTDTITWNVGTLAASTTQSYTVTSTIKTGTAPGPVCNTASLLSAQNVTPILSDPPLGNHCATVTTSGGCTGLGQIRPVFAVKRPTRNDVTLSWTAVPQSVDGYRVCHIDGTKNAIPTLCGAPTASPVTGCNLTTATTCVHTGGVPTTAGTRLFYQVKGVCGSIEGP